MSSTDNSPHGDASRATVKTSIATTSRTRTAERLDRSEPAPTAHPAARTVPAWRWRQWGERRALLAGWRGHAMRAEFASAPHLRRAFERGRRRRDIAVSLGVWFPGCGRDAGREERAAARAAVAAVIRAQDIAPAAVAPPIDGTNGATLDVVPSTPLASVRADGGQPAQRGSRSHDGEATADARDGA